jgi:hypothetical protein
VILLQDSAALPGLLLALLGLGLSELTGNSGVDRDRVAHDRSSPDLAPVFPPHIAYGGNEHLVFAVRHRTTLAALDYDYTALARN